MCGAIGFRNPESGRGEVDQTEPLRDEGPFGDHTGHYTLPEPYRVFHLNPTHDPEEQRWKALENHEMLRARKYLDAVYYHEPAKDLRRFGYRIRNRARGDFEIQGGSDALCERFPSAMNRLARYWRTSGKSCGGWRDAGGPE